MAVVHQYFCPGAPNSKYAFKDGTYAIFVGGVFRTSKQQQVTELNKEIELGNEHIIVKPGHETYDTVNDDPLAGLKQKMRLEIEAELRKEAKSREAAINKGEMGSTSQEPIKAASSADVAANAKSAVSAIKI